MKASMRIRLAAAVLGLVAGTAGQVKAITIATNARFTVTTSSTVEIDNPYFTYAAPGSTSPNSFFPIPWAQSLSTIAKNALDIQSFNQEVPTNPHLFTQSSTLIGNYANPSDPGGIGVVLMLDNTVAANVLNNQTPFSTLFAGTNEASLSTALASGDNSTILSFFTAHLSDFPVWQQSGPINFVMSGTLIGFSGPTAVGTSNPGQVDANQPPATASPEPSTLISGIVAGLLGLGYAWRKRQTSAAA